MRYIPGLNGLRALSVFLIIIYHWGTPELPTNYITQALMPDGKFAVNLFFVLSGFLITAILLIEKQKSASFNHQKKIILKFYLRRFLRIFPIYYLTIFLLYSVNLPGLKTNLMYYLMYVGNFRIFFNQSWDWFSHAWTLSVEEQFYLFWPFIIIFIPTRRLLSILILFALSGPVFSFLQPIAFPGNFQEYILTPTCFDAFGIGGLLAYFYTEKRLTQISRIIKILLPFAICLFVYWKLAPTGGHFQYFRRFFESIIACSLLLFCLSGRFHLLRDLILENRVMQQLGITSYGLYLFHYPLPYLYEKATGINISPTQADFSAFHYILLLCLLILISFISYYLIEKPILNLKKRFEY